MLEDVRQWRKNNHLSSYKNYHVLHFLRIIIPITFCNHSAGHSRITLNYKVKLACSSIIKNLIFLRSVYFKVFHWVHVSSFHLMKWCQLMLMYFPLKKSIGTLSVWTTLMTCGLCMWVIIVTLVILLPSAGGLRIPNVRKLFTYMKIDEKTPRHKNAVSTVVTVFFSTDLV